MVSTIVMAALAAGLLIVGYVRGEGAHVEGLKAGLGMLGGMLPMLFMAMIVAGMVQVLMPHDLISNWIGQGSGLKGIFIGSVAGAMVPGGPFVSMPIAAGFMGAGAGLGTMVAFMTGWSVWALARLPLEFGVMGWKFTTVRLACSLILPPLAGLTAHLFFSGRG